MSQDDLYPVHSADRHLAPGIPRKLLAREWCDRRAMRNHGQTLDELARRGGLSLAEALLIVQNASRPLVRDPAVALAALRQLAEILGVEWPEDPTI